MTKLDEHVLVPHAQMTMQPKVSDITMQQTNNTILAEVFPVKTASIPSLFAYQLQIRGGDLATMGGKLAYRLQKIFKGHWFWTEKRIVTDSPQPDEALKPVIAGVWSEQPTIFHGLLAIKRPRDAQRVCSLQSNGHKTRPSWLSRVQEAQRAVAHATADDAVHGAFMTLPRYTYTREGIVNLTVWLAALLAEPAHACVTTQSTMLYHLT